MTQPASLARGEEAKRLTLSLLDTLFGDTISPHSGFRLWDGTRWPAAEPRTSTIVLQHGGALRKLLMPSHELSMTDAYMRNDIDVEGSLELLVELLRPVWSGATAWRKTLRAAHDLYRLPAQTPGPRALRELPQLTGELHSIERDRAAVRYHYDVSNDFFGLWLDPRMQYSSAYFTAPEQDLATAQTQKLERICHTLGLEPGQRLLDIGCGWGGLVLYAAEHFGVDVTGITLSEPQAALANQRIAEAGLSDRARVQVRDYRELERPEPYDALVSVNMSEHIGEQMLPTYFELAHWALRGGGRFLLEGVARHAWKKPEPVPNFRDSYIFPDGELVPISVTLGAAEDAGFEVRSVESLREHYSRTMLHWVRRLEAQHAAIVHAVDEAAYRIWRLYLAYSVHSFSSGRQNLHQALLVKGNAFSIEN